MRLQARWDYNSEEDTLSVNEWKEFITSRPWIAVCSEIKERDNYIVQCLRTGDSSWSDDVMRARLNELEYVLTIPEAIIADKTLSQRNKDNNDKGE